MKVFIFGVLLFWSSFIFTNAQKLIPDRIFLNNGSIISGEILEVKPNETIKIQGFDENIWVFKHSEVDSIRIDGVIEPQLGEFSYLKSFDRHSKNAMMFRKTNPCGYYNQTTAGLLLGSRNNEEFAPFSLLFENGYFFCSGWAIGMVTGIEFYNVNHVPLATGVSYFYEGDILSPFFKCFGGLNLPVEKKTNDYYGEAIPKGGPLFNAEVGLAIHTHGAASMIVAIGYRYQNLTYEISNSWQNNDITRVEKYNRLNLRMGFLFR